MRKPTARRTTVLALGVAAALLTGCAQTSTPSTAPGATPGTSAGTSGGAAATLTLGTTDKVTSIDPAGSYDNGSFFVMSQVYPFLLNTEPGASDMTPVPDIAESADFSSPTEYTVKLKSGLTFANGHALTSSDVKFSFDRQVAINDPNGPASLLGNLDSVATPDDTTVVFTLKSANDQVWPQILTSPAGPIVDEEVFPADAVMPDADIVAGKPWAGPYGITTYNLNQLVSYAPNDAYEGLLGAPKNAGVNVKYYADSNNLKLDISQKNIDVAYRSLSATDIESLRGNSNTEVNEGPGGEIRYIVFNIATMPFGTQTAEADPAKAKAVRQAMANLIDRDAIATDVYKQTYTPLYSHVPAGMNAATQPLKSLYGDGNGKPSADKAKQVIADAGVTTPVTLKLQYNPDHYGPSSGDEYAAVKSQLESSGLFQVDLQSTEWVQYTKERTADVYPMYQLGWFPDYSDPDNYLTPFFAKNNFLSNHFDNAQVQDLLAKQATTADAAERQAVIGELQDVLAEELSTLPLLQGKQFAVSAQGVQGAGDTLDASFKFRLGVLSK